MTTTFDRQNMTTDEYNEAICTYSALMLHDDGIEITAERLTKAIKSSGNDAVPYWPSLFAKALQQNDVGQLLANVVDAFATGAPSDANIDVPEVAVQEEVKIEIPVDHGPGNLFDSDDDY